MCGVTMFANLWQGVDTASTRHRALSVLVATALPLARSSAGLLYLIQCEGLSHTEQHVASLTWNDIRAKYTFRGSRWLTLTRKAALSFRLGPRSLTA